MAFYINVHRLGFFAWTGDICRHQFFQGSEKLGNLLNSKKILLVATIGLTFLFTFVAFAEESLDLEFSILNSFEPSDTTREDEIVRVEGKIERWRLDDSNESKATASNFKTYSVSSDGSGKIKWSAPDGYNYYLDTQNIGYGYWTCAYGSDSKKKICYRRRSGGYDGEIHLSLLNANSFACTLLHYEDDTPRKIYYATDAGNGTVIGNWAFLIKEEGNTKAPVRPWASYKIMCVK